LLAAESPSRKKIYIFFCNKYAEGYRVNLLSVVGMFTARFVCSVAIQLALAAVRNRGDR
jgi:hypothetical protein